ncbi:hypothetical protein HK405_000810, partial [Cladochytrium tenue]
RRGRAGRRRRAGRLSRVRSRRRQRRGCRRVAAEASVTTRPQCCHHLLGWTPSRSCCCRPGTPSLRVSFVRSRRGWSSSRPAQPPSRLPPPPLPAQQCALPSARRRICGPPRRRTETCSTRRSARHRMEPTCSHSQTTRSEVALEPGLLDSSHSRCRQTQPARCRTRLRRASWTAAPLTSRCSSRCYERLLRHRRRSRSRRRHHCLTAAIAARGWRDRRRRNRASTAPLLPPRLLWVTRGSDGPSTDRLRRRAAVLERVLCPWRR